MRRAITAIVTAACAAIFAPVDLSHARELTFEQRVAAQEAIERIYYGHQIGAMRPFAEVVTRAVLERKVRTALDESEALARFWGTPVTAEALRRERARIEEHTLLPQRLREVYEALGGDAFLIEETLVRAALVDRLARSFFAADERTGEVVGAERSVPRLGWDAWWEGARSRFPFEGAISVSQAEGIVHPPPAPESVDACGPAENWDPDAFGRVPNPGKYAAVWTGSHLLLWRGLPGGHDNSGRYDPLTDTWSSMSTLRAPDPRNGATAVWTGTEMIVWGGIAATFPGMNTGGRYNPATNTWLPTSTRGAPSARYQHSAVWTGSRMIVWGGGSQPPLKSGASYDPQTDSWTATSTAGVAHRSGHVAIWTGSKMVVWGGGDASGSYSDSGARYDPVSDTWQSTSTNGAASPRNSTSAVWTGSTMIVWGGRGPQGVLGTGARYDPGADSWAPVADSGAPSARDSHTVVWTGTRAVVWGGSDNSTGFNTGGRYDPANDSWTPTTTLNAPAPRGHASAVWTGSLVVAWGGLGAGGNTGGRYDPANDSWTPTGTSGAPSGRSQHTAVWTGSEWLIWGGQAAGSQLLQSGGRYDPLLDAWSPTSLAGAPSARYRHTAVWTGSRMVVWGGWDGSRTNTGGRYDPLTDQWAETSLVGAPEGRERHTAAFGGSVMVIWGGTITLGGNICQEAFPNTGWRYDPVADSWQPATTVGAPVGRYGATAVWTGSRMLVWGGERMFRSTVLDPCLPERPSIGGQYDPALDQWFPMAPWSATGALGHRAVWTGSDMIVWGGDISYSPAHGRYDPATNQWSILTNTGGPNNSRTGHSLVWDGARVTVWGGAGTAGSGYRYDPAAHSWSRVMSETNAPQGRDQHSAVWTGESMLVWGGSLLDTGGRYLPGDNDTDGDGTPSACDTCPYDPWNDIDADGVCLYEDNCPSVSNVSQSDADGDGHGDACDDCVTTSDPFQADSDGDGTGDVCDNCASARNPRQTDTDGDGVGNLCDLCPSAVDPSQVDSDADGAGDACDCQPADPTDRSPAEVGGLQVARSGPTGASLTWTASPAADRYSITRSLLSSLAPGTLGSCLADGIAGTSFDDGAPPPSGDGFTYLVEGQSYECGMAGLGAASSEVLRVNGDPLACAGQPHTDSHASAESSVFGTVSGSYQNTASSDDLREVLTEVLSTGSPATRFSRLEQHWTVEVAPGSIVELHVEGFRTSSADGDDFTFEYSTDGGATFTPISLQSLPLADDDIDLRAVLPATLSGTVLVRVVDTDRTPGHQTLDTVAIDELWVRSVP